MKPAPLSSMVVDFFKKSFVLLIATLISYNITSAQEGGTKQIRILYMVPSDSIEKPEYVIGLQNAARHLQIWYYNALGQNKTFNLHDPIVEVYQTPHESLWYSTNPNGSDYFWENVLDDGELLTGRSRYDPNNVWVHYIDANPACEDQCGGCGVNGLVVISANDLKGLVGYEIDTSCPDVWRIYPPSRYVGGLGHELGHALGLPHPPPCDEDFPDCWDHDLMMWGYTTYPDSYFTEEDKNRLSQNPFINEIDIEGLFFPSNCNELTDTCNYSTQVEVSILYGDSIFLEGSYQKTPGFYYDTISSTDDCDSLLVTHLHIIVPPVDVEDVSICEGEIPELSADGENIRWYGAQSNPLVDLYDIRDGQTYRTVAIGNQIWMAENMNYYTPSGSWYYYSDSASYAETYGRLYNWETARKSNPLGWHLPSDDDWQVLIDYLGGYDIAGGKLKETGYAHWDPPNSGADNESGFTARPAGKKDYEGDFHHKGYYSKFWSATKYNINWSNTFEVRSNSAEVFKGNVNKRTAFGVRYIRDENLIVGTGQSYTPQYRLPGTYTYYVTQTVFGVESPPDTVVLNIRPVHPDPAIKEISICEGDSVSAGEKIYSSTGTYYDTLQTKYGCDSIIAIELTVHPVFETEITEDICEGENIFLGGRLQTTSGIYYDTLHTINGCDSVIITELKVNEKPYVFLGNDTTITTRDTMVLDAGIGHESYLWSDGSDQQMNTIYNLSPGDHAYSVWVENAEHCTDSDTIMVHVVLPDPSSSVSASFDLAIFPNPTSDFLYIKSNIQVDTELILTLIDNSGKVVLERKIEKLDITNSVILDLSDLETGFHILRINGTAIIKIHKIIKE